MREFANWPRHRPLGGTLRAVLRAMRRLYCAQGVKSDQSPRLLESRLGAPRRAFRPTCSGRRRQRRASREAWMWFHFQFPSRAPGCAVSWFAIAEVSRSSSRSRKEGEPESQDVAFAIPPRPPTNHARASPKDDLVHSRARRRGLGSRVVRRTRFRSCFLLCIRRCQGSGVRSLCRSRLTHATEEGKKPALFWRGAELTASREVGRPRN